MALKTKNNYKKKNSWLQKNKRLALFVATFAAIGGFFLWRSFAGTALSISMDACANGKGYYIAQIDGTVTAFGEAEKKIGMPSSDRTKLNQGVVDIASTPDCKGYWIMTGAGRVLAYGNASFKGQITEDAPEGFYVALVPTSTGQGYWIVNKLGGVTAKGDAEGKIDFKQTNYKVAFGGIAGVNEIVDADVATSDKGLYLLDKNGKVYTAGDAERRDDVTLRPGEIATSISAYNMNRSYYVATSKGKVFAFGSGAKQKGDRDGDAINGIITSLVYRGTPGTDNVGYWMLDGGGKVYSHGSLQHYGGTGDVKPVVFVDPCAGQDLKDVQKLQRCLNWKGAKPTLAVDGVFGPQTREACQQIFKNYCPYADPVVTSSNGSGSNRTNPINQPECANVNSQACRDLLNRWFAAIGRQNPCNNPTSQACREALARELSTGNFGDYGSGGGIDSTKLPGLPWESCNSSRDGSRCWRDMKQLRDINLQYYATEVYTCRRYWAIFGVVDSYCNWESGGPWRTR